MPTLLRSSILIALVLGVATSLASAQRAASSIPVIYTSDLFHPFGDPDDHYDLATLFALPELDVRAIVIDMPQYQDRVMQPGAPALEQIFELTGRTVPWAVGLREPLESLEDTAREREAAHQQGVELILSTLKKSREQVILFATGSLADVAAAFNREPELLRDKLRAVYVNAGVGPDGIQDEYNVRCDPHAFARVMTSDLPLVWFPCFGRDGYRTYFQVEDSEMIQASPPGLRRYFVYALSRSQTDPIAFLEGTSEVLPKGPRNMWCTPAFLHAAGRKVYRTERGYEALRPERAKDLEEVIPFTFHPLRLAAVAPAAPAEPTAAEPGQLVAALISDGSDRVGVDSPTPDGQPDCRVLVTGLQSGATIASVTITGPREGRWESNESKRWWRTFVEHDGDTLRCDFCFWAAGEHRLNIRFENGMQQDVTVLVTLPGAVELRAQLGVGSATAQVVKNAGGLYGESMTSCLKNLLADWPVKGR